MKDKRVDCFLNHFTVAYLTYSINCFWAPVFCWTRRKLPQPHPCSWRGSLLIRRQPLLLSCPRAVVLGSRSLEMRHGEAPKQMRAAGGVAWGLRGNPMGSVQRGGPSQKFLGRLSCCSHRRLPPEDWNVWVLVLPSSLDNEILKSEMVLKCLLSAAPLLHLAGSTCLMKPCSSVILGDG